MMANRNYQYLPIADYGVIGNLQTVALVSLFGSIDFMCFPRFDSPSVFCRLLDKDKGGYYSIIPEMNDIVTKQLYLPDTNVLVTRFFSEEGIAEIIDYMPVNEREAVIRRVSTIRGKINYTLRCSPALEYATVKHTVMKTADGLLFKPENGSGILLMLQSEVDLDIENNEAVAHFHLKESEQANFVLLAPEQKVSKHGIPDFVQQTYLSTINFWQNWISQAVYSGRWEEVVRRSVLTLKLLISDQYGSMIAAPTFALPEAIGQMRNWDYRYTWIRDAAFSMHALLQLGFISEAERFLQWVMKQSTEKNLQLMFSVDGNTNLEERQLDHLDGYKGSRPVRVGNYAHRQTQMDIYGELLETIFIFVKHGGDITYEYWKIIEQYVQLVIGNWHKPDHSIWEVRGETKEFLFSRIMCWVALDRAIRIGDIFSFPYDFLKWREARNAIYIDVYSHFWNDKKESFVQSKGSHIIDASALLMPILNMISPSSEKWMKTMLAIKKELSSDVLIYRYREQAKDIDGLKGREGTFTMCSFWYVECLALAGETGKAKEYFEKMLGYSNHLGLYSEQLGMKGEHLGNFPQAFTHLSLISAAIELSNDQKEDATYVHGYNKEMK